MDEATLAAVREELAQIAQAVADIVEIEERIRGASDDRALIESASMRLHSFYNGIERCLERIVREFEGLTDDGGGWHKKLLTQAAREVPGFRRALFSDQHVARLDRFRAFRHFVRHGYAFHLDRQQIEPLLRDAPEVWALIEPQIRAFLDAL